MGVKLINIGYGNFVAASRLISVVAPDGAPIRRMVQDARENRMLVDASCGRRTRAVIVMDDGHVVLSALQPETVAHRLDDKAAITDAEAEEEETNE